MSDLRWEGGWHSPSRGGALPDFVSERVCRGSLMQRETTQDVSSNILSSSETAPGSEPGAGAESVRTRRGRLECWRGCGRSDGLGFSVVRCAHLSCVPWISELVSETSYLPLRRVRGGRPEGFRPEAGWKTQQRESSQELRDVKSRSAEGEFGREYER